jgi:broad specificity phosphatase PhoE
MPKKQKKENKKKVPLNELSYESFENMSEAEVFKTYAAEIEEYADWIWREQDRGGPMYSLEQCIDQAKKELMDGNWGPASR